MIDNVRGIYPVFYGCLINLKACVFFGRGSLSVLTMVAYGKSGGSGLLKKSLAIRLGWSGYSKG